MKENFKNYVRKVGSNNICKSKKLVILANGPSLNDVIQNWKDNDNFEEADILAVNYFCLDKAFMEIKPKYYVLSDPQFFDDKNLLKTKADEMYAVINEKVTWQLFLYIQYYAWRCIDWSIKITNENIKIIPCHSTIYTGYKIFRNWFFKHGLCSGNYGTVVLNAELIGLNLGYQELYLYGVDHNFFDKLFVDEDNQLCNSIKYFYDKKSAITPLSHYYIPGKETKYTITEYLKEKAYLFQGHEIMRKYADYCSAKIYNCTKNSLIDSYERL
jgi:hypothetical protein